MAFGPENLGIPPDEIRQRVEAALAAVELLDYRLHPPQLLSGGRKQRAVIAGALAARSSCWLAASSTNRPRCSIPWVAGR